MICLNDWLTMIHRNHYQLPLLIIDVYLQKPFLVLKLLSYCTISHQILIKMSFSASSELKVINSNGFVNNTCIVFNGMPKMPKNFKEYVLDNPTKSQKLNIFF